MLEEETSPDHVHTLTEAVMLSLHLIGIAFLFHPHGHLSLTKLGDHANWASLPAGPSVKPPSHAFYSR